MRQEFSHTSSFRLELCLPPRHSATGPFLLVQNGVRGDREAGIHANLLGPLGIPRRSVNHSGSVGRIAQSERRPSIRWRPNLPRSPEDDARLRAVPEPRWTSSPYISGVFAFL